MEAKFLALTAQAEALKNGNSGGGNQGYGSTKEISWRYKNPENKTEMVRNDRKDKFCEKNCHKQPMLYARPNYLTRSFCGEEEVRKGRKIIGSQWFVKRTSELPLQQ